MFLKLCFKLKWHEITKITWKSLICNKSYYFSDLMYKFFSHFWHLHSKWHSQLHCSGSLYLLCWNDLIKQQWAVWASGAGQALVSPDPGPRLMIAALCSAGSIMLLPEERQCQAPGDYVPLQTQWVETDGKCCCTPAHLLSINLLLDGPSHLPVVTL